MIDGARETLRWLKNLISHASPVMKALYILLFGVLFAIAVIFIPFFNNLSEYFSKAHPMAQSFLLVFLFAGIIASVLFSYERGHRVDQLKDETSRLSREVKDLTDKLNAEKMESAEKLKAAQTVNEQLESRWNALADVEARQNIWQRPWLPTAPPFIPTHERGTRTRFLSMLNLKGGVGKTTLTANLAACSALMEDPLRVLILDLDFQGSLSDHTVDPQLARLQSANDNTVLRLLDADFDGNHLNRLMTPMFHVPGVKVVLATDELESTDFRLQAEYFVREDREVRFLLRERLHCQAIFHQFDLVIFDCPPRLTTSAVNALACSDFVLIPTKLDQDSINSVPRTIRWLDRLAGVVPAQLLGIVANDVSLWEGSLTKSDQNSYNYLRAVVAQSRAGNPEFVFQATIKSDSKIPPAVRGVVSSVNPKQRPIFAEFVRELRRRIDL